MTIKPSKSMFVVAILATVILTAGCDDSDLIAFAYPANTPGYFPTNSWRVVGQTGNDVIVETTATNLPISFRVIRAMSVSPLTNGQPVRVELMVHTRQVREPWVVSAKAYPSID